MIPVAERWSPVPLGQALNETDQLLAPNALASSDGNQLLGLGSYDALLTCSARNGDSSTPLQLEDSFVSKGAQGSQHRVGVDAENGGQVSRWREFLSGL